MIHHQFYAEVHTLYRLWYELTRHRSFRDRNTEMGLFPRREETPVNSIIPFPPELYGRQGNNASGVDSPILMRLALQNARM